MLTEIFIFIEGCQRDKTLASSLPEVSPQNFHAIQHFWKDFVSCLSLTVHVSLYLFTLLHLSHLHVSHSHKFCKLYWISYCSNKLHTNPIFMPHHILCAELNILCTSFITHIIKTTPDKLILLYYRWY